MRGKKVYIKWKRKENFRRRNFGDFFREEGLSQKKKEGTKKKYKKKRWENMKK